MDDKQTPIVTKSALIERFRRDFARDALFVCVDGRMTLFFQRKDDDNDIESVIKRWFIVHRCFEIDVVNVNDVQTYRRDLLYEKAEKKLYATIVIVLLVICVALLMNVIQ